MCSLYRLSRYRMHASAKKVRIVSISSILSGGDQCTKPQHEFASTLWELFFSPLASSFLYDTRGFFESITRKLGRYEGRNFNQTFIPRKLVQIPSSKSHRIPAAHAQSAKVPKIFTRSAAIRKIFMHMFLISTIKSVIAIDTRGH